MPIAFNHTIVTARDKQASARFVTELFGLPPAKAVGRFLAVEFEHGVNLDFLDTEDEIHPQHYAFLVSDEDFDAIYGRIRERGLPHWADPATTLPGQINNREGGRGVYFRDPVGHLLEIITRAYGSTP